MTRVEGHISAASPRRILQFPRLGLSFFVKDTPLCMEILGVEREHGQVFTVHGFFILFCMVFTWFYMVFTWLFYKVLDTCH